MRHRRKRTASPILSALRSDLREAKRRRNSSAGRGNWQRRLYERFLAAGHSPLEAQRAVGQYAVARRRLKNRKKASRGFL